MIMKHHANVNKPIGFETAYLLGVYAISVYRRELQEIFPDTELADKQSIAALCALHNKETYRQEKASEQIAGITAAVIDYDLRRSAKGFLIPKVEYAIDNCGMGGDLYRTPNVSTLAGLIAAADGIPMCKHGSPGNTDSCGSSDFLEIAGMKHNRDNLTTERSIERYHFGYTDALDTGYKRIHQQTHFSARLAHMNDIIGPLTNPLHPGIARKKIVGINHMMSPKVVAEACRILNGKQVTDYQQVLCIRGFVDQDAYQGIDEVSVFLGGTDVAELYGDQVREYHLEAEDFGIPVQEIFETPAGRKNKAEFSLNILSGEIKGVPKDLVLANAALLFYLAEGENLQEAFQRSKEILESGKAEDNFSRCLEDLK